MTSGNASGVRKSKIQSIVWPGPAMKPSSDIALFTTTLPVSVLISGAPYQDLGTPGLNHKSGAVGWVRARLSAARGDAGGSRLTNSSSLAGSGGASATRALQNRAK